MPVLMQATNQIVIYVNFDASEILARFFSYMSATGATIINATKCNSGQRIAIGIMNSKAPFIS